MSKTKVKELIICVSVLMVLALVITTNVFATTPGLNSLINEANENEFNEINAIGNNTNTNNTNNTNTNNTNINNTNTNNTNSNKNNTTMPNTGVSYTGIFVIIVCGISAIYAYKKIREYNV